MNVLLFNLRTDAADDVLGFTTTWVNAIARRVNRVVVITMHAGLIDVESNVTVLSVGRERGYSEPRRLFRFYRLLQSVVRRESIDVCFAHMMPLFAVLGWPLLRVRGIPIVMWYAHGHIPPMVRMATILVDRVVASGATGFPLKTEKLRLIGQGIDVERFAPEADGGLREGGGRLVLVTIGRISRVKSLDVVIRALHRAVPAARLGGVDLILKIYGRPLTEADEDHATALHALVAELGVGESVRFMDAVPFSKVHEVLRDSDVFVNASDTDSLDKAVLEAMSCGVPVLTSNVAFEKVFSGDTASLCLFPRGSVGDLSDRIVRMARLRGSERKRLGLASRDIVVREHSLESLTMKLAGIFDELSSVRRFESGVSR